MLIGKSIGVLFQAQNLQLAVLSRKLKQITVNDLLTVENFRLLPLAELQKIVAAFLKRNKTEHARLVLLLPRQEVIQRQIELPAEAVANLAKVVEYQLTSLLPDPEAEVCHDFTRLPQTRQSKMVQVDLFLVTKSSLETHLALCEQLGLKIERVVPSGVALSNYFLLFERHFKLGTAVLAHHQDRHFEAVGAQNKRLSISRSATLNADEDLAELVTREAGVYRAQMGLAEADKLDIILVGDSPNPAQREGEESHFRLQRLTRAAGYGLRVARAELEGHPLQSHFLAIAAAVSGLWKKLPVSVNLLPPEKQAPRFRWALVPAYALLGVNLLIGAALLLRRPLQASLYANQLGQEVSLLEPEVRKIRSVEKQIADYQRRFELLENPRSSHALILEALNELSRILPGNTWVYSLSLKNQVLEINGASEAAAALPQILDNSVYFKEAEFVGSIARDATGKELYRIRMTIKSPAVTSVPGDIPKESASPGTRKGIQNRHE